MYKILIIDDEVLVRVGLKTTIDWEEIGFTVVAEASNGEQAYGQYKKHSPDLIITDIKMPKQDGLWLIEEVRKENKDVKILVLTCYDEFSYVRKALKLGADDYILKSEVEDEELISVMEKIKSKIDEQSKTENIQNKFKSNRNDMKKSLLNEMKKTNFNIDDKIIERCSELEFAISNTQFALISIVISEETIQKKSESGNSRQLNNAIANIIFDQLVDKDIEYLYNNNFNSYIFLLSFSKINVSKLKTIFSSISNAAKQYFDISLKIVYTNPFTDIEQTSNIYKDFIEKAQITFYEDEKSSFITNIKNISFKEVNVFDLKKQYNSIFNEYIGKGNSDYTNKLNYEVINYFKKNNIKPKIVKIFYSNLIGDIFNSYEQIFESSEEIMHYEYYHYRIINSDNMESIVNLLSNFTAKVINEIKHSKYSNSKLIVSRAINYIKNNYDKKISLEDIAQELNLSKHYFCSVFKKETGETTSLYINKLRIGKAKKMLLKQDYKIKEIFEEVGFSNQHYFSKVFKKITGMTITEYRDSNNN